MAVIKNKRILQNGHHRLEAAIELGLETLKVDEIIPYNEAIKSGIIELISSHKTSTKEY